MAYGGYAVGYGPPVFGGTPSAERTLAVRAARRTLFVPAGRRTLEVPRTIHLYCRER